MSRLTAALQSDRPSRKLCLAAANRIAELEEALIAVEMMTMGLEHKQYKSYRDTTAALKQPEYPE